MSSTSPKGSLPYGWIVKTSTKYPDRVYYFNLFTGATTWECPELDPPRLLEIKEESGSSHTSILNKSLEDRPLFSVVEPEETESSTECQVLAPKTVYPVAKKDMICNNLGSSRAPAKKNFFSLAEKSIGTNLMHSAGPAKKALLPSAMKLPLLPLPNILPSGSLQLFFSNSSTKASLPSPQQSQTLTCSAPMPRKRKFNVNASTADTSKVLNPPTAVVAPVVLEKNAASSSSLPASHKAVKLVYKNKVNRLKKPTLQVFSSSTPSTSKGVEQSFKSKAKSSCSVTIQNKSNTCTLKGGLRRTDKKVSAQSKHFFKLNIPTGRESYSDLDLISVTKKRSLPCSSEVSSSMQNDSQNNSCEDVEMLDVSADLTKIDDLAVLAQPADDLCSYYVVIDTNVLIHDLNHIDEMKDTPLGDCGPPHIFIPWIVIEELDALKQSGKASGTGRAAQQAVRYLNKVLKSKHPRFHGQSPQEAEDCAKVYSKCNDDKILECCMSLALKMPKEKVILITYDKNLINKALICDIIVHNWDSLVKAAEKPDVLAPIVKSKKRRKKRKNSGIPAEHAAPSDTYCTSPNQTLVKQDVCETASLGTPNKSPKMDQRNEVQTFVKEQDVCKTEIHAIMSEARQLLKGVLESFLFEEMDEAYGKPWLAFPINKNLLKGVLDAISKYWRTVFTFHYVEKDRRNFELLRERVSRPEGFLGDREDCLSTLTAIEDVFCRIKRRWPKLEVPIEKIEDLRGKCNDTFTKHNGIDVSVSQIQSSVDLPEAESVLQAFDNAWTVINHLCGMVMDFYHIQHQLVYEKPNSIPEEVEFRRLMVNLYPAVQNIKKLMLGVVAAIKNHNPRDQIFIDLHKALIDLVPTLQIQANNPKVPNFNPKALERFCRNPENAEKVQLGCKQVEYYFSQLDKAQQVMSSNKCKFSFKMALG